MAGTEETKGANTEEQKEEKKGTEEQQEDKSKNTQVDEAGIKAGALKDFMAKLGVEDEKSLSDIVAKHKEDEEKNMTDLDKKDKELKTALTELANVKKEKEKLEAKLNALLLGANKDALEDLVIVATSKVTDEKNMEAVMQEIKDSPSGRYYFQLDDEESEEKDKKETKKKTTVTRKNVEESKKKKDDEDEDKHEGSLAARIFKKSANGNKTKSHYFTN